MNMLIIGMIGLVLQGFILLFLSAGKKEVPKP